MTEKVAHKEMVHREKEHRETDVTVIHKITVDICIAEEIKKLNNDNDIFTLSSCCGHGETGYIIVAGDDIQEMIKLGYEITANKYLDNDIISSDAIVMCGFKPKSICKCNRILKGIKMKIEL